MQKVTVKHTRASERFFTPRASRPRFFKPLTRGVAAMMAAGAVLWSAHGQSLAQVQTLPHEIVSNTSALSSAQSETIRQFVAANAGDLGAEKDPSKIRRARNTIMEPLNDAQVSAPFRLEYTRALEAKLNELVGMPQSIVVINALLVAGELATEPGVAIVEKHLTDKDVAVRFAAVKSLGTTLDAMGRRTPALSKERAQRIVETLGRMMPGEADDRVNDVMCRGLIAGIAVNDIRDRAVSEVSNQMSAWLKKSGAKGANPARLDTLIVVGGAVRDAAAAVGNRPKLNSSSQGDALKLGAEMLNASAAIVRSKEIPAGSKDDAGEVSDQKIQSRVQLRQVAALGAAIVELTGDAKNPQLGSLARYLESGSPEDDARFLDGVDQVLKALPR